STSLPIPCHDIPSVDISPNVITRRSDRCQGLRAGYHPPMTLLGVDRRRAGTAMLVFGVIGVVLAGLIALALVGTAIATRDLDERLAADQAKLAETIDDLATTTAAVVTSMENASATLETSSTSILHARDVLDALASATTSLADGLE